MILVAALLAICVPGRPAVEQPTCVTDGDTFRWHGERIRIADIDAPELAGRCPAERQLRAIWFTADLALRHRWNLKLGGHRLRPGLGALPTTTKVAHVLALPRWSRFQRRSPFLMPFPTGKGKRKRRGL